jgi:hypothetical protein
LAATRELLERTELYEAKMSAQLRKSLGRSSYQMKLNRVQKDVVDRYCHLQPIEKLL